MKTIKSIEHAVTCFGARDQHAYSVYKTKKFMFLKLLLALLRMYF